MNLGKSWELCNVILRYSNLTVCMTVHGISLSISICTITFHVGIIVSELFKIKRICTDYFGSHSTFHDVRLLSYQMQKLFGILDYY